MEGKVRAYEVSERSLVGQNDHFEGCERACSQELKKKVEELKKSNG